MSKQKVIDEKVVESGAPETQTVPGKTSFTVWLGCAEGWEPMSEHESLAAARDEAGERDCPTIITKVVLPAVEY